MNFKTMGVINVTPNSFSDGGKLQNPRKTFLDHSQSFDIVDVGAESTAPFNAPISAGEELTRLVDFFSELLSEKDPETTVSIDSYRPEVFYEVALELRRAWPKSGLIFNDVSGKVDSDLMELMKTELSFSYVFSHNLCPHRDMTSNHMDYLYDGNLLGFMNEVVDHFKKGLDKLRGHNKKIILDPCFGFSKTRDQSLYLLNQLGELSSLVEGNEEILIGVSRKSFLRLPRGLDAKVLKNQEKLDHLQSIIAYQTIKKTERPLIFRSHKSEGLRAVKDAFELLTD